MVETPIAASHRTLSPKPQKIAVKDSQHGTPNPKPEILGRMLEVAKAGVRITDNYPFYSPCNRSTTKPYFGYYGHTYSLDLRVQSPGLWASSGKLVLRIGTAHPVMAAAEVIVLAIRAVVIIIIL